MCECMSGEISKKPAIVKTVQKPSWSTWKEYKALLAIRRKHNKTEQLPDRIPFGSPEI